MSKEHRLTTIDNPFNPFTEFDEWFSFDCDHGYNCCGKLARFIDDRPNMTEKEEKEANEEAIDKFLSIDFTGIYCKIDRDTKPAPINIKTLE